MLFCRLLVVFKTNFFRKKYFGSTTRVSNNLDPDQAQRFVEPGPEVIKLFHAFFHYFNTKFQLLIIKYRKIKKFLALSLSDVFTVLINVKMPTIVGILTFMSRINSVLS